MRTSRAMRAPLVRGLRGFSVTPGRAWSGADLLTDQAADLAAVRGALRLAHHVADDLADRRPAARLDRLHSIRIGLDRRLHDLGELVAVAHRGEALGLDD